jgi:hypothetical protein
MLFNQEKINMKNITICTMSALVLVTLMLATPAGFAQQQQQPAAAAMQTGAPSAQSSPCGNNPLCFEANDFVATISQFRVSPSGGGRILDVILHFQNKTNQPLSLGYVNGSGSALDDRGNRFGLDPYRGGLRGMGIINGNNMDPKFVLRPGGSADVAFELGWGGGALSGVSYSLDLDIREINAVEGNQWVLGTETFLHYQGLTNGMGTGVSGSSGSSYLGSSASQAGCSSGTAAGTVSNAGNAAGAQNSNSQAAVSNAQATLSSFKSLFGKKNSAPTTNTASATPCTPVDATAGSSSSTPTQSGNAVMQQSSGAAVPATGANQNSATTAAAKSATTQAKPAGVTNASSVQKVPSSQSAKPPATAKTGTTTTPPAKTTPQ